MKIARRFATNARRASQQVILFHTGDVTFAIAATAVEEIRGADGLQPFAAGGLHPRLAKVKYTLSRGGARYLVVDSNHFFRMLPTRSTRVLVLRGQQVCVLVDGIERMADVHRVLPLPLAFSGEERAWYRGLILFGDHVVPLVNENSFLSKAESAVLQASLAAHTAAEAARA